MCAKLSGLQKHKTQSTTQHTNMSLCKTGVPTDRQTKIHPKTHHAHCTHVKDNQTHNIRQKLKVWLLFKQVPLTQTIRHTHNSAYSEVPNSAVWGASHKISTIWIGLQRNEETHQHTHIHCQEKKETSDRTRRIRLRACSAQEQSEYLQTRQQM